MHPLLSSNSLRFQLRRSCPPINDALCLLPNLVTPEWRTPSRATFKRSGQLGTGGIRPRAERCAKQLRTRWNAEIDHKVGFKVLQCKFQKTRRNACVTYRAIQRFQLLIVNFGVKTRIAVFRVYRASRSPLRRPSENRSLFSAHQEFTTEVSRRST